MLETNAAFIVFLIAPSLLFLLFFGLWVSERKLRKKIERDYYDLNRHYESEVGKSKVSKLRVYNKVLEINELSNRIRTCVESIDLDYEVEEIVEEIVDDKKDTQL
ncbi:MAG: hypothetical protein KAQ85_00840 [Thermodesulfovibrionia bacterium]|nr:hypothetical protein [Thermodesulfovibrionia bacterium]